MELAEVGDFLAQHAPFDSLPGEVLYVVRSGAVDVRSAQQEMANRLPPGYA